MLLYTSLYMMVITNWLIAGYNICWSLLNALLMMEVAE